MPHADSSGVSSSITTKAEFWDHIYQQLQVLLEGQRNWVTVLANTSSLVYNALLNFPAYFGTEPTKAVNWCGFYLASRLFPGPKDTEVNDVVDTLLLGPFCGKPACQFIKISPNPRGVCSGAFVQKRTLLVPNVDEYPGHIACDGDTKSEIVCPLLVTKDGIEYAVGVFDLDCLAIGGFDDDDKIGLERITKLVVNACDWY